MLYLSVCRRRCHSRSHNAPLCGPVVGGGIWIVDPLGRSVIIGGIVTHLPKQVVAPTEHVVSVIDSAGMFASVAIETQVLLPLTLTGYFRL